VSGLSPADRRHLRERYLLPRPRTELAGAVAAHATAAMDVSDGLAGDLAKLLGVSGVGALVEAGTVPLSDAARAAIALDPALRRTAFTGGDDYEILLTCRGDDFAPLAGAAHAAGIALTHIGDVTEGSGLHIRDEHGLALDLGAGRFEHF
jgi:thiamine-monophosphate kinase